MCDMTLSYVWHDSCICATWLIHMCDMTIHRSRSANWTWRRRQDWRWMMTQSYMWHDSCVCVTWLIHMCDMTHLQESQCALDMEEATGLMSDDDSVICVTWLMHMCDMTHSYVWHDIFVCVIHMCDMTHSYVWHDSFTGVAAQTGHGGGNGIDAGWWSSSSSSAFRPLYWRQSVSLCEKHCNTLQHAATYCNTLQHAATRCNTLQYTATKWWRCASCQNKSETC